MKTYIDHGSMLNLSGTGVWIPKDPLNQDYQRALQEVAAGVAEIIPAPVPE